MALRFFLLASCLVFCANVHANHHAPDKSWTFTFRFENDLFAGTDRHYTNGIKLSLISPDLTRFRDSDKLPEWGKRIVNRLPYSQVEGLQRNIVFSIGQNMYTPADIKARGLIRNDRPYAGWLYGSAAFLTRTIGALIPSRYRRVSWGHYPWRRRRKT